MGRFIDYKKVPKFIKEKFHSQAVKIFYYSAFSAEGTRDYSLEGKHSFFAFSKKGIRFEIRKKKLKKIYFINTNRNINSVLIINSSEWKRLKEIKNRI